MSIANLQGIIMELDSIVDQAGRPVPDARGLKQLDGFFIPKYVVTAGRKDEEERKIRTLIEHPALMADYIFDGWVINGLDVKEADTTGRHKYFPNQVSAQVLDQLIKENNWARGQVLLIGNSWLAAAQATGMQTAQLVRKGKEVLIADHYLDSLYDLKRRLSPDPCYTDQYIATLPMREA